MAEQNTRRGRHFWSQVIEDQQRSGISQRAYCEREALALSTFSWWRRRLTDSATAPARADFVELVATATAQWEPALSARGWDVELELGDGMTLRLRRGC